MCCDKTDPGHECIDKVKEHHDIHDILHAVHERREMLVKHHGDLGRSSSRSSGAGNDLVEGDGGHGSLFGFGLYWLFIEFQKK